jgi:uncharacterized membrane protein
MQAVCCRLRGTGPNAEPAMKSRLRLLRHLWLDADDVQRALGSGALDRLEQRVHDSESRHGGEICLCVEASLPASYLWRHLRQGVPMEAIVHERALALFGKLRVWDTELNNGVLIYLQLAEHRVEIIADRALARKTGDAPWQSTIVAMTDAFGAGRYEEGLAGAIDAVTHALERFFPAQPAAGELQPAPDNELSNRPVIR